jgi:hypothetical protein
VHGKAQKGQPELTGRRKSLKSAQNGGKWGWKKWA